MQRIACFALLLAPVAIAAADPCPALARDSRFEWTVQAGPDFDVCYAHVPGETSALFGLYLGYAASFQARTDMVGEPGTVSGREVSWFPRTGKDGDFPFGKETLLELPQGKDGPTLQVHVWINAQTSDELQAAQAALETMAVPR